MDERELQRLQHRILRQPVPAVPMQWPALLQYWSLHLCQWIFWRCVPIQPGADIYAHHIFPANCYADNNRANRHANTEYAAAVIYVSVFMPQFAPSLRASSS